MAVLGSAALLLWSLTACDSSPTEESGPEQEPELTAVFCPDSADVGVYEELSAAVAAVEPGGVVRVCDGTHAIGRSVTLGKPLTLEAQEGASPVLEYGGSPSSALLLLAAGRESGDLTIRGLTFRVGESAAILTNPDPSPQGGWLVIRDNQFEGDGTSHAVRIARAGPVQIVDNVFTGAPATGWIKEFSGNTVLDPRLGIGINLHASLDSVRFTDNVIISAHVADSLYSPRAVEIRRGVDGPAGGITVTVTGNTITTTGGSRDPQILGSFPLFTGISIRDADAVVELAENEIVGPYYGVSVYIDTTGTTVLDAHDNILRSGIAGVYLGYNPAFATLTVAFHRNDVTDYQNSLLLGVPLPAGVASCNWWGDAAGPVDPQPAGQDSVFEPVATEPIAGRPGVSCP